MRNLVFKSIPVSEIFCDPNFALLAKDYGKQAGRTGLEIRPNRESYLSLENAGLLSAIGAYDVETLVGFAVVVFAPSLHHSGVIASVESLWLAEDFRQYTAGLKLLKEVEKLAVGRKAKGLEITCPTGSRQEILFAHLFRRTNSVFFKNLEV